MKNRLFKTLFANRTSDAMEITVLRFKDFNVVQFVYNGHIFRECLNLIKMASLVAKLRLMCPTTSFADVGFDKLPVFNIYTWQNDVHKTIYIFSNDGEKITKLARDIQQVLKCLI
ncbi:hypothetical protein RHMOL_Rhmol04G0048000 [Rhododendron molle]|uniref:Uncharacterized protein n=1 Tax=Rhododendron molle TaxID=49168 RepID=A0ACC0NZK4_RHOML|nr:hypothetical protein RHMOL_Rhmol04G0048000 [Rhododendron molle]